MKDTEMDHNEEQRRKLQEYIFELEETQEKAEELSLKHEKLQHSQNLLMAILSATKSSIALVTNSQFAWCNRGFSEMFGWNQEEIVKKTPEMLYPNMEEYRSMENIIYAELSRSRLTTFEYAFVHKDGRRVPCLVTGCALDEHDFSKGYIFSFTDITVQRQAEEALVQERNLLRTLINNMPDYIYAKDAESRFILVNTATLHQLGVTTTDQVLGKTDFDFHAQELAKQYYTAEQEIIRSGQPQMNSEEPYLDHAAGTMKLALATKVALRDSQGKIVGIVGINRDITERKRTEEDLQRAYHDLENTQAQLVQSAKLASIGELAAGVAHELNQPLMVIRTNAQFVRRTLEKGKMDTEQLLTLFEPVERNTKRMMNIINHLRTFSRQSQGEFSIQNINTIIENAFLMVGEQLRLRNIAVKKHLTQDIPKVRGDASQLEQVFLNLITNARDAIEVKGAQEPRQIEIVTRVADNDNDWVEILVKDSGKGIIKDALENIFDPFFTTKEIGKGTGLGLSISYGIVKEHQGEIEVVESNQEGTIFRVQLPSAIDE